MWWILGFGALVLVTIFFYRQRKVRQQEQIIEAGIAHMLFSLNMLRPIHERIMQNDIDPRVWSDQYLLGYFQGSISVLTDVYGNGLNAEQKGFITLKVLQTIAGENWRLASRAIEEFYTKRKLNFILGMGHGSDVAALIAGRAGPALLADPDVQNALRQDPASI